MEATTYPRSSNNPEEHIVSNLLPQTGNEGIALDLLKKSEVVDGTRIQGTGSVSGHSYRWRLIVESGVRSVAQVPDRFFDIEGRSYPIDWNSKVSVFNGEAPAYSNFKDAIIYKIGDVADGMKAKPYIIFDAWMDNAAHKQQLGKDSTTLSLQAYLTKYGFNASTEGTLVEPVDENGEKVDTDGNVAHNVPYSDFSEETLPITEADYLAIVVDNNDIYHAYVGKETKEDYPDIRTYTDSKIAWYTPEKTVNVNQFKGLDMWIRFSGINSLIYFILTKYNQDILSIIPSYRELPPEYITMYRLVTVNPETKEKTYGEWQETEPTPGENQYVEEKMAEKDGKPKRHNNPDPDAFVDKETTEIREYDDVEEKRKHEGKLWAYVNPRTMKPFDDDYWFHEGEPYYIKSLTIAPKGKEIKANKIVVKADQWPGMYMFVGETYIRDRDTGEDQRMQIKFPLCKVKADQTLTLEAEGDPTVFGCTLEVARPKSGAMMELTAYEIAKKMELGDNGCYYEIDGSTEVVSE